MNFRTGIFFLTIENSINLHRIQSSEPMIAGFNNSIKIVNVNERYSDCGTDRRMRFCGVLLETGPEINIYIYIDMCICWCIYIYNYQSLD